MVNKKPEGLESRVNSKEDSQNQSVKVELSLNEYTSLFEKRYFTEAPFRQIVHQYLGLSRFQRMKLAAGKRIVPSWHKKKAEYLVRDYAQYIYNEREKALRVQREIERINSLSAAREKAQECLDATLEEKREIEQTIVRIEEEKKVELTRVVQTITEQRELGQERLAEEQRKLEEATNLKRIIKEKLVEKLQKEGLVKSVSGGFLTFDDDKMVKKLEDYYLEEILTDMGPSDSSRLMARTREAYGSLITHTDVMDDLSELSDVDWVGSAIYSRTRGYKRPQFPFMLSGKRAGLERKISFVDTAIALDSSGSMADDRKYEIARKTTLAQHALMRKLNPSNNTYLAVFPNCHEVDTLWLTKEGTANGGTPTHWALKWMLDKLKDSPVGIANLITDGYPDSQEEAIAVAKEYQKYPNVFLRIFLIDANNQSEKSVKELGLAAGRQTKFMPIRNYQLANGAIRDVADVLTQMQSVYD